MNGIKTLAAALAFILATAGIAAADSNHGRGAEPAGTDGHGPAEGRAEMMHDMMRMMMPMMMQMRGRMMGAGADGGMAMMDDETMRMMMGPDMMAGRMSAEPGPEATRAAVLARLAEFDADSDGSLSLAEFETLHAAMIREAMVDRFQHLDADGDGHITEAEMAAPARRMEMRRRMPGSSGMMDGRMPSGN